LIDSQKLYQLIGERVRRIRESQTPRMNQDDLARILELKRTSITNIERGKQKISLDCLYRFCDRFGVSIQEFIPPVSDVAHGDERSIVVGGESHEVGAKTASLVARLRPDLGHAANIRRDK
jgi:transcriptional regulator with XRE-family HTH domain